MNSEDARRKMMKNQAEVESSITEPLYLRDSTEMKRGGKSGKLITMVVPGSVGGAPSTWKPAMVVPDLEENLVPIPPERVRHHVTEEVVIKVDPSSNIRYILMMSRFNSWCLNCKDYMNVETRVCPGCGVTFTHISTDYTCLWMADAAKNARPDLTWIAVGEVPGVQLFA